MGHKAVETTTINLAQKLLMNIQCCGGSRNFANETRALKMRSAMTGHQKADRRSTKPSLTAAKTKIILQKVNHNEAPILWPPDVKN